MKRTLAVCLQISACVLFFCFCAQAQSSEHLILYDDFNQQFLNPNKWATSSPCFTWTVLECAREVQNGRLRLEVRGYGATNSNQGTQYGESELHFINPARIRAIATQMIVRRTSAQSCAVNPNPDESGHAHSLLSGAFFNSGSGSPSDDVQAFLIFDRLSSDPPGVTTVQAFMQWEGQFFGGVSLGTVNVGQKIIARLIWDQRNHRFVASWTDMITGNTAQATMPYTQPDVSPAAAPDKLLGVRTFTPNCVGPQMLVVDLETTFDNVMVGRIDE
jgi:hypothetical protein